MATVTRTLKLEQRQVRRRGIADAESRRSRWRHEGTEREGSQQIDVGTGTAEISFAFGGGEITAFLVSCVSDQDPQARREAKRYAESPIPKRREPKLEAS